MTAIPEYLKKLLYQYDCVVVPDLGGFLTQHQPARFELASPDRIARRDAARLGPGRLEFIRPANGWPSTNPCG
jgi:hypothetical protein